MPPLGLLPLPSSAILQTWWCLCRLGQGTLSSVEGTSLKGTVRGWAGVWDLLCLGLCATSGRLPFVVLRGPSRQCQSHFWGSEHSLRGWCWEVVRDGVLPSRERFPPGMPWVLRM